MKKSVEVCLTPELIHQHELGGKIAVVVDIFRATSCIVAGLHYGVNSVTPVGSVEACLSLGKQGFVTAGERGGQKIEEFDIGNSPFDYQNPDFIGRDVAITTTNGTMAIERSRNADEIVIGSFLNLSPTAGYLKSQNKSVVIHCAGWKGTPNIEDTLFAGAMIDRLGLDLSGDSSRMSLDLFKHHEEDLLSIAKVSGHARRLAGFGITKDIEYCMNVDEFKDVVVGMVDGRLVKI